jgi:hypothetical protein
MDDPASKSLRDRLDALLRRAREISAEIERRVEEVTAEPSTSGPPDTRRAEPAAATSPGAEKSANSEVAQEAMEVAAEAVAVTAEAAAVTAEALSTIASESGAAPEIPPIPPDAPTTVVPEAAAAAPETKSDPDTENEA